MKKIITIVGARPQFIKAAMLSRVLADYQGLEEIILHTGQHYDHGMSDVFFSEMNIPRPKYNLGVGGGNQGAMTGRQLEGIETVLIDERPDCVLVYGDTNSTLAGSLAAAKLHIPVAHVEAGLRSYNRRMPEEVNRVLTDHLSRFLLTPSHKAALNLAREGLEDGVHFVGDIMYDAALFYAGQTASRVGTILDRVHQTLDNFVLVTVHRQENTDAPDRLEAILDALRQLAADRPVVLPIHPRLRKMLEAGGKFDEMTLGLTIIAPVGFVDMISLLQAASLVLTDSGGVQKEAYFHGTPAVILRDETEWGELVDLNWATLCPPNSPAHILAAADAMTGRTGDTEATPYGSGDAAERIAAILLDEL
ncbi:UDP-N-acetylglucosamine 2-epimerase (non-hydrolyzing) [Roseivivax sp. GX 12232]|uniref:non-hydrolyzing UDP-N-acetylglucosamine 2-epimerase n=1 Tax=Roseivivax sp. GX 12232 TaxID=2900547 RepID=UPI001E3FD0C7|nr:UDP-N-acetylglucosamine 2-epimerase (non-hydrolyzing) [Roseivivax sp. GX 12232]MCE0506578.1 UDP-N-acetylglucosamine 2-epimerase (non-hydrolyzing) [Roseivivax sp. GX 12232]